MHLDSSIHSLLNSCSEEKQDEQAMAVNLPTLEELGVVAPCQ